MTNGLGSSIRGGLGHRGRRPRLAADALARALRLITAPAPARRSAAESTRNVPPTAVTSGARSARCDRKSPPTAARSTARSAGRPS